MFKLANRSQVSAIRNALFDTFTATGCELHRRRLSDPSGGIGEVQLYWKPALGLWAYFSPKPHRGTRWFCWFGSSLGKAGTVLTPSVEINLTVDPTNRSAGGRTLTNGDKLYLGHKGLLGGGRGGQMGLAEFGENIRGFVREPVTNVKGKEEFVFVLGDVNSKSVLHRLREFVSECERLREIARSRNGNSVKAGSHPKMRRGEKKPVFNPETGEDGTGGGYPIAPPKIRRIHGRVVNALKKEVGPSAVNGTRSSMRPDLYVLNAKGQMQVLYEVKASSDTQSWFTALGQLVVYSAPERRRPRRVLVCPAERQDLNFVKALKSLGVRVVTFRENKGKVSFEGL